MRPTKNSFNMKLPIMAALHEAEVLSLDVFDTCLLRIIGCPNRVFTLIEDELRHCTHFDHLSGGDAGYANLRIRSEWKASERLMAESNTSQWTLDEIYREFQSLANISAEDADKLKCREMEVERTVLIPNPQIQQLAKEASQEGKRIVYISDMYLPQEFIADLLRDNGYPVTDGMVFVSGENRVGKGTGDLYDVAAKHVGIPFSKWCHIGDNYECDVKAAQAKGINAFHYPKVANSITEKDLDGRKKTKCLPIDCEQSLALGLRNTIVSQHAVSADNNRSNFWHKLGFERVGILMLGYVNWLIEECLRDKNDLMVFGSRDGFILKRCFDLICKWRKLPINSVYLHASRKAIIFPSLCSFGEEELRLLLFSGAKTVGQYLSRCDLDPNEYQHEIIECGFNGVDDEIGSDDSYTNLRKLFENLYSPILNNAAQQSKLVAEYLDDLQIPTKGRIGMVDVGWYGHPLEGFERLMRLTDRDVQVTGYYLGTHAGAKKRMEHGLRMKSYLLYLSEPASVHKCIENYIPLIEFLFLASHGTCLGFERTDQGVSPILSEDTCEQENIAKAMKVHEGIIDFFHAARDVIVNFPHIRLDPLGAFYPYAQTMVDPTIEEAHMLGDLTHAGGFGKSKLECIADPSVPADKTMWIPGAQVRKKWNKENIAH